MKWILFIGGLILVLAAIANGSAEAGFLGVVLTVVGIGIIVRWNG